MGQEKEKESQTYHELSQLFLVELGDGPKHALPGSGPELCIRHGLLCHTNDLGIFPDVGNERVLKKYFLIFLFFKKTFLNILFLEKLKINFLPGKP